MFSLSRPSRRDRRRSDGALEYSPFSGSPETSRHRAVGQAVHDEDDVGVDPDHDDDDDHDNDAGFRPFQRGPTSYFDRNHRRDADREHEGEEEQDDDDENEDNEDAVDTPLLPMFSAAHLDRLPLYNITHAIRLLIVQRCETTLSWDQLRSPQVSQFLVKPIQSQIRTNHFNRATICALIANCLQFYKEGQVTPGNVGVLRTRALISELLAMRLVKEFSLRELIDALSYDFDPLRGMSQPNDTQSRPNAWANTAHPSDSQLQRARKVGRVSTIEIAIKAQAKRFLAHPLVVQHLEAIWAGSIVFHSEADDLHRKYPKPSFKHDATSRGRSGYGTIDGGHSPSALPADSVLSKKAHETRTNKRPLEPPIGRRAVTLYDPREASLFKLSRLRVPRYRQLFSTISFATMLGLYIAVLHDRSLYITPLEVLFWVWSIGYMLDEVIGFTEQGYGLYILSFWNAFDLGILLLFAIYYALRLYGIVLADEGKHRIASMSYDVLGSTAVLLFPRLFSVLDHYRYFSQLLIAFRMMSQDLLAILVLIIISCSGFFVAFTLSFSDVETDGGAIAYTLFQLLMGFTPAAWDRWDEYNVLGKAILTIFLFICHFLIVTILITVLTNSFMAIVQNASEEHQFLFAINTLSMVKSDMLFSYIAPTNVIGWLLSPLRYILPFRRYIRLNRTIIKLTHFPILWSICAYERLLLARMAFDPTDLVERHTTNPKKPVAFSLNKAPSVFSPGKRLVREPSVISFHKDRALDEVFRRPFRGSTIRTTGMDNDVDPRHRSVVVDNWMQQADDQGGASPPMDQPRSVLERLEHRRPQPRRALTGDRSHSSTWRREFSRETRSAASDPDIFSINMPTRPDRIAEEDEPEDLSFATLPPQETDADGDDETNAESETGAPGVGESAISITGKENRTPAEDTGSDDDFFHTPVASKSPMHQVSSAARARMQHAPAHGNKPVTSHHVRNSRPMHERNASIGTVLFAPPRLDVEDSSASNNKRTNRQNAVRMSTSGGGKGNITPNASTLFGGQRTPKLKPTSPTKRPGMLPRTYTAPQAPLAISWVDLKKAQRKPSFNARALDLASEIGDNKWTSGGIDAGGISGIPASFSEQFMRERDLDRAREAERRRSEEEEKGMVNRIMLARMNTLEEGFREVIREIKDMSQNASNSRRESGEELSAFKFRSRQETATSNNSSSGVAPPKTPIGRISGNSKAKKNQKKMDKRSSLERPASSTKLADVVTISPDASTGAKQRRPRSADDEVKGLERTATGASTEVGPERPTTAFKSTGRSGED